MGLRGRPVRAGTRLNRQLDQREAIRGRPSRIFSRSTAALVIGGLALVLSACSGGGDDRPDSGFTPSASDFPEVEGRTIEEIFAAQAESDRVASPAGLTFEVGLNRYPFGVFEVDGKPVDDAEVALYFAKSPRSEVEGPLPATIRSLETKPAYRAKGAGGPGDPKAYYEVRGVRFERPGPWLGIAVFLGPDGPEATRLPSPVVGKFTGVPAVGDKAPAISTPTAETVGGDLSKIDTRLPPSTMHGKDLKDVLGKKPVALVFATPALCQTRVCGPVVDVAEQVKDEVGEGVEFIHMEIYNDNDANKGFRPQVQAYGLPTEPWVFLIGRDGRIEERFEGAYGVAELREAVERLKRDD